MHNMPIHSTTAVAASRRKTAKRSIYCIDTVTYRGSNVEFDYTLNGKYFAGSINFTDLVLFTLIDNDLPVPPSLNYDFIAENILDDVFEVVEAYLIEHKIGQTIVPAFN